MSAITDASNRSLARSLQTQKAISESQDAMDDSNIFFKLMKKAEDAAQAAT
jgi:hypothetical protein